MNQNTNLTRLKWIEFSLIFVLFPISLTLPFLIWIKLVLGFLGFFYVLYQLIKNKYIFFKNGLQPFTKKYVRQISLVFLGLLILTTSYMYFSDPEKLFYVLLEKPKLWIFILFVYSFLSVLPQEIIYRSFYFSRYKQLFKNETLLVFINAIVFSLAHLFFQNTLVLGITFVGGLIFGFSYLKTRSLVLVSIEHAIYGCWLFTVGMGDMLGFPAP